MSVLAPSSRHNSFYYPSSMSRMPVSPSLKPPLPTNPRELGDPYTLDQWLLRDEAVARCFVDDAKSLRQVAPDVFMLNTFPCKYVELVGMIVSIDVRENKTSFTLDDGSSQNIEVLYYHNIATLAQKSFKVVSQATFQTPLGKRLGYYPFKSSFAPPPPPPPPITLEPDSIPEHKPKIQVGDVTRLKVKVKKYRDNLYFDTAIDPERTDLDNEPLHVISVLNLHREIYPSFTQTSYLQSPFLPKKASTSTLAHPVNSYPNGSHSSPQKARTDRSSSLGFSDLPVTSSDYGSQSSSPFRERSKPSRDPSKIPSNQTTLDELKLWIKEYMTTRTEAAWDQATERDLGEGPVKEWFSELRSACRSSFTRGASSFSSPRWSKHQHCKQETITQDMDRSTYSTYSQMTSFNTSTSFDDTLSFASTSSTSYYAQLQSKSPSEPTPDPPFTIRSLSSVPHLLLYAQKIVKKTAKEWETRRRAEIVRKREEEKLLLGSEGTKRKKAKGERWFELPGLKPSRPYDDEGWEEEQAQKERERRKRRGESYTSKLKDPEWVAGKVRNLLDQLLSDLIREGEIVRADPPSAESSPPTETEAESRFLPLHLTTLGPVLLRLINTENAVVRTRSKKILPAGIRPPFGVDTSTVIRRLKASEERWYFVSGLKVEEILEKMDKRDWVEFQRGGWRALGS